MYFSMDEIGYENALEVNGIKAVDEKWRFIYKVAKSYGFEGIHFTPSLYNELGLDLNTIPEYFGEFKLTMHLGGAGVRKLASDEDCAMFSETMGRYLKIAERHNMHDISIHPPRTFTMTSEEREMCERLFRKIVDKWLGVVLGRGISLSLETHVTGEYFMFNGLGEYEKFIDEYPELGVLIDVSHNFYDGFSVDEIIKRLSGKNVKGLHLSDARQGVDFREGTHLAVGEGDIDFGKILKGFKRIPNIYSVLEIKANNESMAKSLEILKAVIVG